MPELTLPKIHILLASYNGSEFITEQLDSIFSQSHQNIKVTVRDDGSTDNTVELINNYKNNNDVDIALIENSSNKKGHSSNFAALSEIALKSECDYFCFSDQDDVWHSNKLSLLVSEMQGLEKSHANSTPILLHSDLVVVDAKLKAIAPSFVKFQGLPNPKHHSFPEFSYQNVVTGCACMFNKALLNVAVPIPACSPVHDWWFAVCAQSFGIVKFIDMPLINYRQHGVNSIGATHVKDQRSFFKKYIYQSLVKFPFLLSSAIEQAKYLKELDACEGLKIKGDYKKYISEFSNIKNMSFIERSKYVRTNFKNRSKGELVYLNLVFFSVKWL